MSDIFDDILEELNDMRLLDNLTYSDYSFLRDAISKAALIVDGISPARLTQICEAEREQRLVILPCKVGDTVYEPYDGRIFTWPFHGASVELHVGGGVRMMDDFGKTVFLTRAEAEAALAQEGGQP